MTRITIDPSKRGGRPCIRGLRITVYDILTMLSTGMSHAEILDDFFIAISFNFFLSFKKVTVNNSFCLYFEAKIIEYSFSIMVSTKTKQSEKTYNNIKFCRKKGGLPFRRPSFRSSGFSGNSLCHLK